MYLQTSEPRYLRSQGLVRASVQALPGAAQHQAQQPLPQMHLRRQGVAQAGSAQHTAQQPQLTPRQPDRGRVEGRVGMGRTWLGFGV